MMIRAIAIYEMDTNHSAPTFTKTKHHVPKESSLSIFSTNLLENLETLSLPLINTNDLTLPSVLHFTSKAEHHYFKKIFNQPFMMAICSKQRLTLSEARYLFINIEHAFLHPDSSRVSLDAIIRNPLAYTGTDHLPIALLQDLEAQKELLLKNIEAMLDRGEKLDEVGALTLELNDASELFKRRAEAQNRYCSYC